jgi:hypothetical protein
VPKGNDAMSETIQNLHKVLGYMAESPDFNESSSMIFVHDAIKELESAKLHNEKNWKEIAIALGQRVNYIISYCKPNLKTQMINLETREITTSVDYIADGLEMLPSVKVDREMLGATKAERKKISEKRKSEPVSTQHEPSKAD